MKNPRGSWLLGLCLAVAQPVSAVVTKISCLYDPKTQHKVVLITDSPSQKSSDSVNIVSLQCKELELLAEKLFNYDSSSSFLVSRGAMLQEAQDNTDGTLNAIFDYISAKDVIWDNLGNLSVENFDLTDPLSLTACSNLTVDSVNELVEIAQEEGVDLAQGDLTIQFYTRFIMWWKNSMMNVLNALPVSKATQVAMKQKLLKTYNAFISFLKQTIQQNNLHGSDSITKLTSSDALDKTAKNFCSSIIDIELLNFLAADTRDNLIVQSIPQHTTLLESSLAGEGFVLDQSYTANTKALTDLDQKIFDFITN